MASTSRLLTDTYSQLVDQTRGALATVDSAKLTTQLHTASLNLGTLTHTLTQSLTPSLIHSLTPSLTQSFTHSLTHSLIQSLTHSHIHSHSHTFTHTLTGTASKDIIHSAANVQGNPEDQPSKRALSDAAKVVTEKVSGKRVNSESP